MFIAYLKTQLHQWKCWEFAVIFFSCIYILLQFPSVVSKPGWRDPKHLSVWQTIECARNTWVRVKHQKRDEFSRKLHQSCNSSLWWSLWPLEHAYGELPTGQRILDSCLFRNSRTTSRYHVDRSTEGWMKHESWKSWKLRTISFRPFIVLS